MDKAYNVTKASEILGIKRRTLKSWIDRKKIHAFKYPAGKLWYIKESELARISKEILTN